MLDLGIEPYLVASSVLGVLAQRLLRRVCDTCKGDPAIVASCERCRGTGYRGREGIYELLMVNDEIRGQVQSHAHAAEIRETGTRHGMRLLRESGQLKVEQGLTSMEEVERVTMRSEM